VPRRPWLPQVISIQRRQRTPAVAPPDKHEPIGSSPVPPIIELPEIGRFLVVEPPGYPADKTGKADLRFLYRVFDRGRKASSGSAKPA
jgi:hypothetical protein